jgi:hypothetical protein
LVTEHPCEYEKGHITSIREDIETIVDYLPLNVEIVFYINTNV